MFGTAISEACDQTLRQGCEMSPSEKIEMTSSEGIAQQFYSPWEGDSAISSWNDAIAAITEICKLCDAENVNIRTLAWRGQADSSWSLHSSLYRHLNTEKEWGKPPRGRTSAEV
jgi:hypothetical protein